MKKETVILSVVIAFLVGFITGATVAILKGKKGAARPAAVQPSPAAPATAPVAPLQVHRQKGQCKIQTLKILFRRIENLSMGGAGLLFRLDQSKPRRTAGSCVQPDNADRRTWGLCTSWATRIISGIPKGGSDDLTHVNSRHNSGVLMANRTSRVRLSLEDLSVDSNSERRCASAQMERMKTVVNKINGEERADRVEDSEAPHPEGRGLRGRPVKRHA
jgi:hypothetical protein